MHHMNHGSGIDGKCRHDHVRSRRAKLASKRASRKSRRSRSKSRSRFRAVNVDLPGDEHFEGLPLNVRFNAKALILNKRLAFQIDKDQVKDSYREEITQKLKSYPFRFLSFERTHGIIFVKDEKKLTALRNKNKDSMVGSLLKLHCSVESYDAQDKEGYFNIQYFVKDQKKNEVDMFFRENCDRKETEKAKMNNIKEDLMSFGEIEGYMVWCRIVEHGKKHASYWFVQDGKLQYDRGMSFNEETEQNDIKETLRDRLMNRLINRVEGEVGGEKTEEQEQMMIESLKKKAKLLTLARDSG